MAALTANLMYSNIQGGMRPGGKQAIVQIYHVENFVVGENNLNDVWTASGLPQPGDTLNITTAGGSYNIYVLDRSLRSFDPVSTWEITVTYCESPKAIPAIVNRYATHKPYPVWADNTGSVPRNSVGDIFLPPLTRTRNLPRIEVICRISKNTREVIDFGLYCDCYSENSVTLSWIDADGDTQTMVFLSYTLYLDDVREITIQEPFTHYQLTLIFLEDTKKSILSGKDLDGNAYSSGIIIGWKQEIPNAGPQYSLVPNSTNQGDLRGFQDGVGTCLNGIGLLAGDGTQLPIGGTPSGVLVDPIPTANLQSLLDTVLAPGQFT
jgi:hypothetical protein